MALTVNSIHTPNDMLINPLKSRWMSYKVPPWLAPLCIVIYSLINLIVISPQGNFPLNDDWVYTESVSHLIATNQFHLLGCSASCLLHIALGALSCLIFGYSHEVLRSLTWLCGLITCLALYKTLSELGTKKFQSLLLTMVLAANPIFVNLSFSFMTDIPALMFCVLYALFTICFIKRQNVWYAVAAGLMLCCAILIRQTFAVLILCNVSLLLLNRGSVRKPLLAIIIACVVFPLCSTLISESVMRHGNSFIAVYTWYKAQFVHKIQHLIFSPTEGLPSLVKQLFKLFCYFGLFCLPLIPLIIPRIISGLVKRSSLHISVAAVAALITIPSFLHTVFISNQLMPFNQNLLRLPMVGPLNLMGICIQGLKTRQRLWLTIISAIGCLIFLSVILEFLYNAVRALIGSIRKWQKGNISTQIGNGQQLTLVFVCLFLLATMGFLLIQASVLDFDRYYLLALPALLLCLGVAGGEENIARALPISAVLVLLLATYSTAATQDYMAWNRARWQAIANLESSGVSPFSIDGGPEFNYSVNPKLIEACNLDNGYQLTHRGALPRANWRWWPITREDYIISFSPVPDYEVIARTPFWGALSLGYREILTLKNLHQ